MKRKKPVTKKRKIGPLKARAKKTSASGRAPRKAISLMASAEERESSHRLIEEFYKPLKKPVTLRLDADVLAWFKRPGRRYQTRINRALRDIMKREMDELGEYS